MTHLPKKAMAQEQPVIPYPGVRSVPEPAEPPRATGDKVSFEIKIEENDVRARQFACHVMLRNNTSKSIHVLAVNYRLGSGVVLEKSDNTSFLDLKKEYDQLRTEIKQLYRSIYISSNVDGYGKEFARRFLEDVRAQVSFNNLFMAYFYMITGRLKLYANQMVQMLQRMEFPVASSEDARNILKGLNERGIQVPLSDLIVAKIDRMSAIEQIDKNFLRREYVTQIQPGEDLEQVYILKAKRKLSSIASYTAAFDVKLAWEESPTDCDVDKKNIERTLSRAVSFNVTPSPITLSILAIIFSFLGAVLISVLPKSQAEFSALYDWASLKKYFVAAVLAVVIYNSIEMTEFRDKVPSISWRSAMLVGILCGLLSDRMLGAITAFVGTVGAAP